MATITLTDATPLTEQGICESVIMNPLEPWMRLSHSDPIFLITPSNPEMSMEICDS